MSMRRLAKALRKNWKFIVGMIVVAAIAGQRPRSCRVE